MKKCSSLFYFFVFIILIIVQTSCENTTTSVEDLTEELPPKTEVQDKTKNSEQEDIPQITLEVAEEPVKTIVGENQKAKLTFKVNASSGTPHYQWYKCSDISGNNAELINGETNEEYETPVFTQKEIRYYYCLANSGNVEKKSAVVAVAFTGLPVVYINTPEQVEITSREEWVNEASITIKNISDNLSWNIDEEEISIKGRGNSSWAAPKKGYNIKFADKKSLFGMSESKKWCLISNYSDRSLLHNKYVSEITNSIFNDNIPWNPKFQFVELILNGKYLGNYILGERITLENGRINYQDISKVAKNLNENKQNKIDDVNNDNVKDLFDGGFILEIDVRSDGEINFITDQQIPVVLKDPDSNLNEEVIEHIKQIVKTAEDNLYNNNLDWINFIDVNSVIDYFIINEFSKNLDSYFATSVYITFNPNDCKFHFGPNWDFDKSFGNFIRDYSSQSPNEWHTKEILRSSDISANWFNQMFEYESFRINLAQRWNQIKTDLYTSINNEINTLADDISISAEMNILRWPGSGDYVDRNLNWRDSVDYMIEWCNQRYIWFDNEMNTILESVL